MFFDSKDFKDSPQQNAWEFALRSYERNKQILALAQKLNHILAIEFYTKSIQDLEVKYPSLKTGN